MNLVRSLIKLFVKLIEKITKVQIDVARKPRIKIKVHPKAVTNGSSMETYVKLVKQFCNYVPQNVIEIGANFGQDGEYLRKSFNLKNTDVFVFEPHPQIFSELEKMYGFNSYKVAVSNVSDKKITFHAIDIENNEYNNSGISSLKNGLKTDKKNFIDVEVESIRMDDFVNKNGIGSIDFLKIDVEGMNYEVLEGFGKELSRVKAIQTESEYEHYWEGQKLFKDMETLLVENNFKLVYFLLSADGIQSDSFWIQEKYLKTIGKNTDAN
jgi:FkbM family methyltransferase